jgi:Putative beta-barrel porin-2, OmpL-like. bbp2
MHARVGLVALCVAAGLARGQDSTTTPKAVARGVTVHDTTPTIVLSGFLDGYYAWDFDRPFDFDRAYTTQPARHAEFNINLAFVQATIAGPRYRGTLAFQFGTSVQANYAGEPRIGKFSGSSVTQFIQQATAGYQLSPTVWIDGGIFYAHTGYEGWVSRDNLAYTRSLIADFSPYYEAGVKLSWAATPTVAVQFDLVNGWQDISNYNTPPALGSRVDWTVSKALTLSYDNFVGNVAADSNAARVRFYNDFIAQYNPTDRWQFAAAFDYGLQSRSASDNGTAVWYGTSVFAKYHPSTIVGIVARVERYADPSQIIVQTGFPASFETTGASIGVDVNPVPRLLWRSELRGFHSDHAVWPTHVSGKETNDDGFIVTSLALTI